MTKETTSKRLSAMVLDRWMKWNRRAEAVRDGEGSIHRRDRLKVPAGFTSWAEVEMALIESGQLKD